MNVIKCILTLCLFSVYLYGATLLVRVSPATPNETLMIELYNSPDTFRSLQSPVKKQTLSPSMSRPFTLSDLPAGDYAYIVYLDQNNNGKLDRNGIGIPKEPVVFSNGYQPKGPPQFHKAAITLTQDGGEFTSLLNPKQSTGTWGGGFIFFGQSAPYKGAEQSVNRFFPALTYFGPRVQWFGPFLSVGLFTHKNVSFAGTLMARFGAFEEDDGPILMGLGDRKTVFMGGFSSRVQLPKQTTLETQWRQDLSGVHHGSTLGVSIKKSMSYKAISITPDFSLEWISKSLANYEFGVPASKANPNRSAYTLDDVLTWNTSVSFRGPVYKNWAWFTMFNLQCLPHDVSQSPLVAQDVLMRYMLGVNYTW